MTRILVVDDVKLFRHMETRILAWRGYEIDEAQSGAEALEKIRQNPPDLVLLDLFMPGMSGAEVCRQLKADPALRSLPVVLITSSGRDEDLRQAVQAGCDELLTKPLEDTTLVRKVEDLLGTVSKRRFPRVRTSMQVSFEDFKGIFFEYARDVSRTGVFIEMDHPLPIGTRLKLSFALPAPFHHPVVAYGRVVRSAEPTAEHPGGVGVAFIHLDSSSVQVLDALVAGQYQPDGQESLGAFSRLSLHLEAREGEQARQAQVGMLAGECEDLRGTLEDLQREHLRQSAMLVLVESLVSAETPSQVLEAGRDALTNLLGAAAFGLFLQKPGDPGRLVPILTAGLTDAEADPQEQAGVVASALRTGRPQLGPPPPAGLAHGSASGQEHVLVASPLLDGERRLGVVAIHRLFPQKPGLSAADLQLLGMLGRHLGRALMSTAARATARPLEPADLLALLG